MLPNLDWYIRVSVIASNCFRYHCKECHRMRENNEPEKLRIQTHFREWKSAESFDSSHKKLIIWLPQNNFLSIVTPKRSFYFKVYLVVSLIFWNRFVSWEKRKKVHLNEEKC